MTLNLHYGGHLAALLLGLLTFAFAPATASAQLAAQDQKECVTIAVDPPNASTPVGDRIDYDLSIRRKPGCLPVYVEQWTFSAITEHLEITPNPLPAIEVGVRPLAGAPVESAFIAQAELWSGLTFEYLTTVNRRIDLTVVDGLQKPDLAIESVDVTPFITEGQPFTVSATARNIGAGALETVTLVSLFVEDRINQSQFCGPLLPGKECAVVFEPRINDPGEYSYELCIDRVDGVDESDETNNCATGTFRVSPDDEVDLVAVSLTAAPSSPAVGQPTQVTAVAINSGGLPSGPSTLRLETPSGLFSANCPALPPRGTCQRSFTWYPQQAGEAELELFVQYGAPEDDVLNNLLTRSVTVRDADPLPDFTFFVSDISMSPAAPQVGDLIHFTATMRNIGTTWQATPPYPTIRATLNGEVFEKTCDSTIPGGGGCVAHFSYMPSWPFPSGTQTITFTADAGQVVPEASESNNMRSLNFLIDDSSGGVSCQGQWTLTGTGSTEFTTSAPGSVQDDCDVFFGQNTPTGICWRTVGEGGLRAQWHRSPGSDCPTSVTVTDPSSPSLRWNFSVSIH